jgi:phage-related tail protein
MSRRPVLLVGGLAVVAVAAAVTFGVLWYLTSTTLTSTRTELTKTKQDLATTNSDLAATRTQLSKTQQDVTTARTQLASAQQDLNTANAGLAATRTQLSQAQQDLAATRTQLSSTQSQLNTLTAGPQPQIVSQNKSEVPAGLFSRDCNATLTATVRNNGAPGMVQTVGTLTWAGGNRTGTSTSQYVAQGAQLTFNITLSNVPCSGTSYVLRAQPA